MSPTDHRRRHRMALWMALAVTMLWSSSWVLIRFGFDDEALSPITFAGLRYGLAAAVLLGAVTGRRDRRDEVRHLDAGTLARLALLGLILYTVTQGAQFVAIDSQPAATTSLILALTPLLVAVVASRSISEQAARRQLVGGTLMAAGALVYSAGDLGATMIGLAAAAVALGANVGAALLGRSVNRSRSTSPLLVTALSMTAGAVVLILAGLIIEGPPRITLRAALLVGWLAVVNTALAFTMWNAALRELSATESAAINNTMLIQIALLAWAFLDEAPGWLGIVGIVTVTLGVLLTQARRAPLTNIPRRRDDGHSHDRGSAPRPGHARIRHPGRSS